MTSQGMVLTKRNGIFVSDKQETMADGKTYSGIDKIFPLSQIHSAGLMMNGNADFENIPVETLINMFIEKTNFNEFETIEEIKNKLIEFFSTNTSHTTNDDFIKTLVEEFKKELKYDIDDMGFDEALQYKNRREIPNFIREFAGFKTEFCDIIPPNKDIEKYTEILWEIFSYELQYEGTGIIIAGYNKKSCYPSFFELNLYCNDPTNLTYEIIDCAIDCEKPIIKIFAVNEEAYSFITGVHDDFVNFIINYTDDANEIVMKNIILDLEKENIDNKNQIIGIVQNALNDMYSELPSDILDFRLDSVEDSAISVENLPVWLLGVFSDHLIQLTAVKQKISSQIETVSMATDIFFMQKSKGFSWLKKDDRII